MNGWYLQSQIIYYRMVDVWLVLWTLIHGIMCQTFIILHRRSLSLFPSVLFSDWFMLKQVTVLCWYAYSSVMSLYWNCSVLNPCGHTIISFSDGRCNYYYKWISSSIRTVTHLVLQFSTVFCCQSIFYVHNLQVASIFTAFTYLHRHRFLSCQCSGHEVRTHLFNLCMYTCWQNCKHLWCTSFCNKQISWIKQDRIYIPLIVLRSVPEVAEHDTRQVQNLDFPYKMK